jgi:7-cyano-7-deazaguanine synthase
MSRDGKRAVVLVSGGIDSATAAAEAQDRGYDLWFLHTSYGQQTQGKEYECASTLADTLAADDFLHIETSHLAQIGGSSLTDDRIEVDEAAPDSDAVPASYVPFRNANLLAMAVSYAEANDCETVFIGAHSEDYSGYPDCRPEFFDAFQHVVATGTKPGTEIEIVAPFATWRKTEIVERGVELGVPFEETWSCYRAEAPACGTCDACAYRLNAFRAAGRRDPITYEQRPSW